MNTPDCDFSPLKQQLTEGLRKISAELQATVEDFLHDTENNCILCHLEEIKDRFRTIETMAGTFYLNCYLQNYTDKSMDLSICVERLSSRHHGALIVIERNDPLDFLIQKGTFMGANLTPTLLETIFYPGNPLHDGAVLIRGNQIVSAANILPLTKSEIVGRKVGTRHRAALGISEQSDALALVVSEETGRVSFALDGQLYPIRTEAK